MEAAEAAVATGRDGRVVTRATAEFLGLEYKQAVCSERPDVAAAEEERAAAREDAPTAEEYHALRLQLAGGTLYGWATADAFAALLARVGGPWTAPGDGGAPLMPGARLLAVDPTPRFARCGAFYVHAGGGRVHHTSLRRAPALHCRRFAVFLHGAARSPCHVLDLVVCAPWPLPPGDGPLELLPDPAWARIERHYAITRPRRLRWRELGPREAIAELVIGSPIDAVRVRLRAEVAVARGVHGSCAEIGVRMLELQQAI